MRQLEELGFLPKKPKPEPVPEPTSPQTPLNRWNAGIVFPAELRLRSAGPWSASNAIEEKEVNKQQADVAYKPGSFNPNNFRSKKPLGARSSSELNAFKRKIEANLLAGKDVDPDLIAAFESANSGGEMAPRAAFPKYNVTQNPYTTLKH